MESIYAYVKYEHSTLLHLIGETHEAPLTAAELSSWTESPLFVKVTARTSHYRLRPLVLCFCFQGR